jgi:hypothetical protein
MDVQKLTVGELTKITLRAAFALVFPTVLLAALGGVAAGIFVSVYRFVSHLL